MIKHTIARRKALPGVIFLGRIVDGLKYVCLCQECENFCGSWCPHFSASAVSVRIACRPIISYYQVDAEPFTVEKV
jgi:hypothetical protein